MRLLTAIVLLVIIAIALPCVAGNNTDAKFGIHLVAHNPKMVCNTIPVITSSDDLVRQWNTGGSYPASIDAIIYVFDYTELLGVEYGLGWPAEWVYSAAWTSCSELIIGSIAWPGDGVSQTFTACQPAGGPIGFGWVWLYGESPGDIKVIGHPQHDTVYVLDCAEGLDMASYGFQAAVDKLPVDEPAIEPTTWSGIKSLFR